MVIDAEYANAFDVARNPHSLAKWLADPAACASELAIVPLPLSRRNSEHSDLICNECDRRAQSVDK